MSRRLSLAQVRALAALSPRLYRLAPLGVRRSTLDALALAGLVAWRGTVMPYRLRWRRTAAGSRALAAIGGAL